MHPSSDILQPCGSRSMKLEEEPEHVKFYLYAMKKAVNSKNYSIFDLPL